MDTNARASSLGQYLTFTLGNEIFALDIARVREVLELTTISDIPRTPKYMRGVINLRGHAVPVMDMRMKLGMNMVQDTVDTCIIIMEVAFGDEDVVLGALVDSVREVFEMSENEIEPAPRMGAAINAEYIMGMGRQEDQFIIIVDVDSIFSQAELQAAADSNKTPTEMAA